MICTDVKRVKEICQGTDLLEVTIDGIETAYWIYSMADAVQYVGKEVIVTYRDDIYNGEVCRFINTFVRPCKVTTLDRSEDIKLYADAEDNYSNMSFKDIALGETKTGCIVYCVSQKFESSDKSVWLTLTVRDKMFRIAKLRLFHYDNMNDFTGKYIMCALTKSEYGLKTDMIVPARGECPDNYEIKIAEEFILNYFAEDQVALSFIQGNNLLEFMHAYVDMEAGYGIVRLAQELSLCHTLYNITGSVNISAIEHALVAEKMFMRNPNSILSKSVRNVCGAINHKWTNPEIVLALLDEACIAPPPEKAIYEHIKLTVDSVIKASKCGI